MGVHRLKTRNMKPVPVQIFNKNPHRTNSEDSSKHMQLRCRPDIELRNRSDVNTEANKIINETNLNQMN